MIFLFLKRSISARVVALPRVITRSDLLRMEATVCESIQSYIVACGKSWKRSRESLLRSPRSIIHSTSIYLHVDVIALKILRDHWLPQITNIWVFSVFQYLYSFGGLSISGLIICPTTVQRISGKCRLATSNHRNIFSAIRPRSRLDHPGIVSDSCIQRGICRSQLAIPTATEPGHPLEKTTSGFSCTSTDLAWSIPRTRMNG